jgi:hypothetical protein
MLAETLIHVVSRVVSAAASFLLFAFVARYCNPEDAKAIYFFAFALGFLVVSLRTFGTISANLRGESRRAHKLRSALATIGQLLILQVVAAVASVAVFLTHPIPMTLVVAACAVVAVASLDADLVRAALNKRSSFAATFAIGAALGLLSFLLLPVKTIATGCFALLLQWLPTACVNMYLYFRLLWRRARLARLLSTVRCPRLLGSLVVAVFDGAVLNAPFLVGSRLPARSGFDLSIAMRLFVSSLPLQPLLIHWSNSRTLGLIAWRLRVVESRLYGGILISSGSAAGIVFAFVYVFVSRKELALSQYGLSEMLLVAYSFYATKIRYRPSESSNRRSLLQLCSVLVLFYGLFIGGTRLADLSARTIVVLQSSTLLIAGILLANASRVLTSPTMQRPMTEP